MSLLGRNCAGRTSTLRAILGLVPRREGSIKVAGRETIAMAAHKIPWLGIGYCPEERGIFASLSAEENLALPPKIADGGMSIEEIYSIFPNLEERRLSPGHQALRRRAADARHRPHPATAAKSCCFWTRSPRGSHR